MTEFETEFEVDQDLTKLLARARRRTILRNILISLVSSLLVIVLVFTANSTLLSNSADRAWRDIAMFQEITGPNLQVARRYANSGFLKGTIEYQTYKIVEGIPVVWHRETVEYNVLGNFRRLGGNEVPISLSDPQMEQENFKYGRSYNNESGQREMLFYHPQVTYSRYLNDIPRLEQIDRQKYVEMAVSFDQAYTVEQMKKMLPEGAHPVWYWVDTYYHQQALRPQTITVDRKMPDGTLKQETETIDVQTPELARNVYGFHDSEQQFVQALEAGLQADGKYKGEYQKIRDYLRGDHDKPTAADVRILGVVVTGTPDGLKQLQGKQYVKAAVLGAVVEKY